MEQSDWSRRVPYLRLSYLVDKRINIIRRYYHDEYQCKLGGDATGPGPTRTASYIKNDDILFKEGPVKYIILSYILH